jgi:hypothetical protein
LRLFYGAAVAGLWKPHLPAQSLNICMSAAKIGKKGSVPGENAGTTRSGYGMLHDEDPGRIGTAARVIAGRLPDT